MKRSTRMIYGITIALITAASLHFMVGHRFHAMGYGNYGYGPHGYSYGAGRNFGCGAGLYDRWNNSEKNTSKVPAQPAPTETPKNEF